MSSGRCFEVKDWTGFALSVFKTGSDAAEPSIATFKNPQAISSIDGNMPDDGALESSSLTSKGSSSVEIISLFARGIGRFSSACLGREGDGDSAFLFPSNV